MNNLYENTNDVDKKTYVVSSNGEVGIYKIQNNQIVQNNNPLGANFDEEVIS